MNCIFFSGVSSSALPGVVASCGHKLAKHKELLQISYLTCAKTIT